MKLKFGAAAAVAILAYAGAAQADCVVVTNRVVILNHGMFYEAGLPILPLQMKARWRVADSASPFFEIPDGQTLERPYPGNYPLVVDLQYSDKLRAWHDGGSVPVYDRVMDKAQYACRSTGATRLAAITTITAPKANSNGLEWGLDVEFAEAK